MSGQENGAEVSPKRVIQLELTEEEEAEIKRLQASIDQRLVALEASLDRLDAQTAASRH